MADPVSLGLMAVGTAMSAAGTVAGGNAAAAAGQSQQNALNYKATQENQQAMTERASAQRAAFDKQRETGLLESKLQAGAAAGGGGASDPTIVSLGGQIAGRGEYESLLDMFKGENTARGYENQATADIASGQAAAAEGSAKQSASYLSAAGTVIGSAGSMYRAYNKLPAVSKYG